MSAGIPKNLRCAWCGADDLDAGPVIACPNTRDTCVYCCSCCGRGACVACGNDDPAVGSGLCLDCLEAEVEP